MKEFIRKKSVKLLTKQITKIEQEIMDIKMEFCDDCPLNKSNDCALCQIDLEIKNYEKIKQYKMRDRSYYENDLEQFVHFNVDAETEKINFVLSKMLKEGSRKEALAFCEDRLHIVKQVAQMYPDEEYLRLIDIWSDVIKQIQIMLGDYNNDDSEFMS